MYLFCFFLVRDLEKIKNKEENVSCEDASKLLIDVMLHSGTAGWYEEFRNALEVEGNTVLIRALCRPTIALCINQTCVMSPNFLMKDICQELSFSGIAKLSSHIIYY